MAKICQSSNFVTLQRALRSLQLRAIRLESIAIRLELESIASRLEAIAVIWLEQKTQGLSYIQLPRYSSMSAMARRHRRSPASLLMLPRASDITLPSWVDTAPVTPKLQ